MSTAAGKRSLRLGAYFRVDVQVHDTSESVTDQFLFKNCIKILDAGKYSDCVNPVGLALVGVHDFKAFAR